MKNLKFSILNSFRAKELKISRVPTNLQHLFATTLVKGSHLYIARMMRVLLSTSYIIRGCMSPGDAKLCFYFIKHIRSITKHQGLPGTIKYLKVSSVLLQQSLSGYILKDLTPLGIRISRTKTGLPSFIPLVQRRIIMSDPVSMRFWLTLLSLYRDIKVEGFVKLSTITSPSLMAENAYDVDEFIVNFGQRLLSIEEFTILRDDFSKKPLDTVIRRVAPLGVDHPAFRPSGFDISVKDILAQIKNYKKGTREDLFLTLKSGPQGALGETQIFNSHPISVIRALNAFFLPENRSILKSLEFLMNRTSDYLGTVYLLWKDLLDQQDMISEYPPVHHYLGKLGLKLEPAGKVRIFAMVDIWTQWVLKPVHSAIFKLLSDKFITDGTFDQGKPLKRVPWNIKGTPIYSYDLTAATDRLPLFLQQEIIRFLFGGEFSHHWGNLLVGRPYKLPKQNLGSGLKYPKDYPESIKYAVGQPMGALSSWAMLALTHHYIVQYSAWKSGACPLSELFTGYALLGDDLIIWDRDVAIKYLETMKILGLEINLSKSIISESTQGLEFAKRTIIRGIDVSPIPYKEQDASRYSLPELLSFCKKYNLSFLQTIRFLGYGYKVDPTKNSRIIRALKIALMIPKSPRDLLEIFVPTRALFNSLTETSVHLDRDLLSILMDHNPRMLMIFFSFLRDQLLVINRKCDSFSRIRTEILKSNKSEDLLVSLKGRVLNSAWNRDLYLLESLYDVSNRHLHSLDIWYKYYTSGKSTEGKPHHLRGLLSFYLKFLVDTTAVLSSSNIEDLLHPKRSISASRSHYEARARLELWNKWSTIMSKVNKIT